MKIPVRGHSAVDKTTVAAIRPSVSSCRARNRLTAFLAWHPGRLAKGTLTMTLGLGLRTLAQAAVFLIVARVLGAEAYGAYSAILALAMALGAMVGLGASVVMLRDTARMPESYTQGWQTTLGAILSTAGVFYGVYLLLAPWLLPEGMGVIAILALGAAEIVFSPLTLAVMHAYQGHERMGRAARMALTPLVPRLLAAVGLPFVLTELALADALAVWAAGYCLAAAASAAYALWRLRRDYGLRHRPCWRGLWPTLRQGWPFATSGAAYKALVDIDKLMLARLTTLEAAGAYSAAYRVVDLANVPLMSFFAAASMRFFRAGEGGAKHAARLAWRFLPWPLSYALAAGTALYLLADWLSVLLGGAYREAVEVLRWLAWLPLVSLPRLLLQAALTGSDRQRQVLYVLFLGAMANAGLNLLLIPALAWQGAVLTTYAVEVLMTLAYARLIAAAGTTTARTAPIGGA